MVFGENKSEVINNEPWFVGKDVAEALGYSNPQEAVRVHVDEEDKGVSEIRTPGGRQKMPIINESGLYSLVLSSKLPSAKQFKRWITAEVLPTIRPNCGYAKKAAGTPSVNAEASRVTSENAAVQPAVYEAEASNPYIAQQRRMCQSIPDHKQHMTFTRFTQQLYIAAMSLKQCVTKVCSALRAKYSPVFHQNSLRYF